MLQTRTKHESLIEENYFFYEGSPFYKRNNLPLAPLYFAAISIIKGPVLSAERSAIHHTLQLSRSLLSTILRGHQHPAPVAPVYDQTSFQSDQASFRRASFRPFSIDFSLDYQLF